MADSRVSLQCDHAGHPFWKLKGYLMTDFEIASPSVAAVSRLCADIRPEDKAEWSAAAKVLGGDSTELPVKDHILMACMGSRSNAKALTSKSTGETLCIWGASKTETEGVGIVWLVASNSGAKNARRVQRLFPSAVAALHGEFPILEAHAMMENVVHIRWLERLGFTHGGPSKLIPDERFGYFFRRGEALNDVL